MPTSAKWSRSATCTSTTPDPQLPEPWCPSNSCLSPSWPERPSTVQAGLPMERDFIAVLDFGGQYAHLIAKRIRHLGVLAKVFSPRVATEELQSAKGIVLSGGPQSVYGEEAIPFNHDVLKVG